MRSVSACRIGLVSIDVHLKTHIRGNADRHVVEDKPPVAAFDRHRDAIAMGDAQDQRIKWRHMNMSLGNNRPAAQLQFGKGAYQADPRGEAFSRQEAGVALRKGNDDLLKAVDGAIADMQKDGSLKALSEKWFGADVTK